MNNYYTCNELNKHSVDLSDIYEYKNNYKLNCFINKKSIFLKTPKVPLHSNIESGYIVIDLNNTTKKIDSFIDFIKKIEIAVSDKIKLKLKKKFKLHSNFVGDSGNTKYIFKTNDKNMTVFDKNKKIVPKSGVEIYSDIILLIKLQDIWINTEKRQYGLNWHVFQCRVFPQFDYNKCIIVDSDNDEDPDEEVKNEIIVQKCVFCNSVCTYKNSIENINIGKGKGGKGKGKGSFISNNMNNMNNTNGGRGIGGPGSSIEKKPEIKKPQNVGPPKLSVTVNELVDIKSRLRKMTKIINSDSD